jgi:NADPH:quinone reductase-like Zn-dependent oxidoreductase
VKAIVVREFGEPSVMRVEEVPNPEAGPGQVLIRIRAVGVNPVDTYIRKGAYARKPSLPYTPGADAAGTIKAVGSGVTGFSPGQRVYIVGTIAGSFGACAELAVCDAAQAHPLPDASSQQAAEAALDLAGRAGPGDRLLFALSGGRHYKRDGPLARTLAAASAGTALRPPLPLALDTLVQQFSSE